MKYNKLYTDEELELFKAIEDGELEALNDEAFEEEKAKLKQTAIETIKQKTKKKSLNIRLYADDIEKIKAIALRQGLPYQTYLSSLIHKVATGQLKGAI